MEQLYNYNNIPLTIEDLKTILKVGDITQLPDSISMFQNSFVHKSYIIRRKNFIAKETKTPIDIMVCPSGCLDLFETSNERLEFLGDSIVGCIIVSYLYQRFPDGDEGFLTKLKSKLVNTNALATFSNYLGLSKNLIISNDVENKSNGRNSTRILEDLFESFIGAMYLSYGENGYNVCNKFILKILQQTIDFESLILKNDNYKDILANYYKKYKYKPKYHPLAKSSTERKYHIGVSDSTGNIVGKGIDFKKKNAEQIAAKNALISFGIIKN